MLIASAAAVGGVVVLAPFGGITPLLSLIRSGFTAAFSLVFVSELGDKTFFIAALLAARKHARVPVMIGAVGALAVMTAISVVLGRLFQRLPSSLQSSLPIGEYLAAAMLVFFGVRSLTDALKPAEVSGGGSGSGDGEAAAEESGVEGELLEAKEFVKEAETKGDKPTTPWGIIVKTFTLIFVAEWGDRSMLATIALGAAQNPVSVFAGAVAGHALATLIAVVGGSLIAGYISERAIGATSGVLFLLFAVLTVCGCM